MTVQRLLLEMPDGSEITEWMAFDRIEPIGDARLDVLFARLAAQLRACWLSGDRGESPADLLPRWLRDAREDDPRSDLEALAAKTGGKVIEILE
jgi:hypothetical protein